VDPGYFVTNETAVNSCNSTDGMKSLQRRSIADSVFALASDGINGGRLQSLLAGC
jgi:hypothetical protein